MYLILKIFGTGVKVEIPRGVFLANFEASLVEKAEAMKGATLAKARTSPSPWHFLKNLWEKYAVPGIVYGTESTPVSLKTISRLDRIQNELVLRGLSLPRSVPACFLPMISGFKPFWFIMFKNTVNFYRKVGNMCVYWVFNSQLFIY